METPINLSNEPSPVPHEESKPTTKKLSPIETINKERIEPRTPSETSSSENGLTPSPSPIVTTPTTSIYVNNIEIRSFVQATQEMALAQLAADEGSANAVPLYFDVDEKGVWSTVKELPKRPDYYTHIADDASVILNAYYNPYTDLKEDSGSKQVLSFEDAAAFAKAYHVINKYLKVSTPSKIDYQNYFHLLLNDNRTTRSNEIEEFKVFTSTDPERSLMTAIQKISCARSKKESLYLARQGKQWVTTSQKPSTREFLSIAFEVGDILNRYYNPLNRHPKAEDDLRPNLSYEDGAVFMTAYLTMEEHTQKLLGIEDDPQVFLHYFVRCKPLDRAIFIEANETKGVSSQPIQEKMIIPMTISKSLKEFLERRHKGENVYVSIDKGSGEWKITNSQEDTSSIQELRNDLFGLLYRNNPLYQKYGQEKGESFYLQHPLPDQKDWTGEERLSYIVLRQTALNFKQLREQSYSLTWKYKWEWLKSVISSKISHLFRSLVTKPLEESVSSRIPEVKEPSETFKVREEITVNNMKLLMDAQLTKTPLKTASGEPLYEGIVTYLPPDNATLSPDNRLPTRTEMGLFTIDETRTQKFLLNDNKGSISFINGSDLRQTGKFREGVLIEGSQNYYDLSGEKVSEQGTFEKYLHTPETGLYLLHSAITEQGGRHLCSREVGNTTTQGIFTHGSQYEQSWHQKTPTDFPPEFRKLNNDTQADVDNIMEGNDLSDALMKLEHLRSNKVNDNDSIKIIWGFYNDSLHRDILKNMSEGVPFCHLLKLTLQRLKAYEDKDPVESQRCNRLLAVFEPIEAAIQYLKSRENSMFSPHGFVRKISKTEQGLTLNNLEKTRRDLMNSLENILSQEGFSIEANDPHLSKTREKVLHNSILKDKCEKIFAEFDKVERQIFTISTEMIN